VGRVFVSANWTYQDKLMLFMKAGHSRGSAPLYNDSVTLGLIYYYAQRSDLFGLAVNYGDPADDSLDDQRTTELFYRLQLAQNLAITPTIQLLSDPALNPDKDEIWTTGVRVLFSF
jgi:porin